MLQEDGSFLVCDGSSFKLGDVDSLAVSQFLEEVVSVLADFAVLASYEALEFAEALEALLEGSDMTSGSATVLLINGSGFVEVESWDFFGFSVHGFLIGVVPANPRIETLQFCELISGWSMFSRVGDEQVRDETLFCAGMEEVSTRTCGCGGDEGAEEPVGFRIGDDSTGVDD